MRVRMFLEDAGGTVHELVADTGDKLVESIFLSSRFEAPALCSGLGRCGQCRIRLLETSVPLDPVKAEERLFSPEELEAGWRLSCLHHCREGLRLYLPEHPKSRRSWQLEPGAESQGGGPLALAMDLGTTSLQWQALRDGLPVRAGSELNPQLGAGSEVMSRISYALDVRGRERLRLLVLQRLEAIIRELEPLGRVERLCVAGNSAMTCVLLDKPVDGLAHAPYHLEFYGGREMKLTWDSWRLPTFIPPLLAPFVGGDLSAGLTWLSLGRDTVPEPPFLLADLGTNGEFILALEDKSYLAASVPMGPALEGVGLAYGNVAGPGTALSFSMRPDGPFPVFPETDVTGNSITGAAYLSLIAHLLRLGVLTQQGHFTDQPYSPLAMRISRRLEDARGERCLPLAGFTDAVKLLSSDVEEILKVKAAFNVAFASLLQESGVRTSDLNAVYLSGAFGAHVGVDTLELLGFLPPGMGARTQVLGNSSLAGAALFLQRPEARGWAARMADRTSVLELAGNESFNQAFVQAMAFGYVA